MLKYCVELSRYMVPDYGEFTIEANSTEEARDAALAAADAGKIKWTRGDGVMEITVQAVTQI